MTTAAQTGSRAPQLRPISPAGHRHADMDAGSSAAVRLREIPFAQMLAIRAEPGSPMAAAVEAELGRLPAAVKQVTVSQQATTCWLSPDEFLAVLTDESLTAAAEVAETIMARAGSAPGHVLDVSANRTTLELSGPAARDILESSATIDLHPRMFPVGTAVATNLAQTQVILHKMGGGDVADPAALLVRRLRRHLAARRDGGVPGGRLTGSRRRTSRQPETHPA